jgi:hypothetical protein
MKRSPARKLLPFVALALVVPALLIAQDTAPVDGWPRDVLTPEGHKITIYEPQLDSLKGTTLYGRAAMSVTLKGKNEPIFGAGWIVGTIVVDRDSREVSHRDLKIPRLRFPGATDEQLTIIRNTAEAGAAEWDLHTSLDALAAALGASEAADKAAGEYKTDPPRVIYSTYPSLLITLDGEPVMRAMEGSSLQRVINTPFMMAYDPATKGYYLNGGGAEDWFTASDLKGEWSKTPSPPAELVQLYKKEQGDAPADSTLEAEPDPRVPKIYVATEPTELICSDGEPTYAPIVGDDLLYMTSTESPVFKDVPSQDFFVVLSGRWYRSKSMEGPWQFVANDQLPGSFKQIPEDSERGDVLAYVAGTEAAQLAVMDAQVPQTAAINKADAKLTVQYDGDPKFEPVPGTDIQYAVNTGQQVLRIDGKYYACDNAVWFWSTDARGPWAVADSIPTQQIQKIPPESPVYNVKYVTIYETSPQVVYVGYTPGYMGCYPFYGSVIYGTGWYYRPWVSPYFFYPRPYTYGFHAHYNPYGGWGFSMSWGGGYYHPPYRPPYYGGGGWYGPGGPAYRPPYRPGNPGYIPPRYKPGVGQKPGQPRPGTLPATRPGGNNIYNKGPNVDRVAKPGTIAGGGAGAARPTTRPSTGAGGTTRPATTQTRPSTRPNDVYADRNGDVYRQNKDGNWQSREGNKWQNTPSTRPSTQPGASTRPSPSPSLQREAQARQQGYNRSQSYNRGSSGASRPAPSSRGGGRPSGGGGGRRR